MEFFSKIFFCFILTNLSVLIPNMFVLKHLNFHLGSYVWF